VRIEATRTVNLMRSLNFDYLNNALRPSWRGKIHAFTTLLVPAAGGYLVSIAKSVTGILGECVFAGSTVMFRCVRDISCSVPHSEISRTFQTLGPRIHLCFNSRHIHPYMFTGS
jgi:hypothetical protein